MKTNRFTVPVAKVSASFKHVPEKRETVSSGENLNVNESETLKKNVDSDPLQNVMRSSLANSTSFHQVSWQLSQ